MTDDQHVNPFDDAQGTFLALVNAAGQYSLWPDFRPPPAGWRVVHGPDTRAACLAHIERAWTTLSPRRD
jgi:MbtH protein